MTMNKKTLMEHTVFVPVSEEFKSKENETEKSTLFRLIDECVELKKKMKAAKALEARWKQLSTVLQEQICHCGTETTDVKTGKQKVILSSEVHQCKFVLSVQERKSLDRVKLLRAGVTPEQLASGVKVTPTPEIRMVGLSSLYEDFDEENNNG